MKYQLVLTSLMFALGAEARLGETTEQCDKRYGEPIKARDFVIEDSETKSSRVYSSGDFNITIEWLQGFDKATSIEYEIKPNSNITFSNDLVFDLLKKNSDGKSWGAGTARRDFFNYDCLEGDKGSYMHMCKWTREDGYTAQVDDKKFVMKYGWDQQSHAQTLRYEARRMKTIEREKGTVDAAKDL